jgi:hypothetical protein
VRLVLFNERVPRFAFLDHRLGVLTPDHNADMVDHIAEHPEVRDMALFVGNPGDIVPEQLGPQLPAIRDWTERHFDFTGYVTGFDPADLGDRTRLRAEPGYGDERVCIVTVGGSGVGADLLRRVTASFPAAKEMVPDLRMIVVAGPRIDPASLPSALSTAPAALPHLATSSSTGTGSTSAPSSRARGRWSGAAPRTGSMPISATRRLSPRRTSSGAWQMAVRRRANTRLKDKRQVCGAPCPISCPRELRGAPWAADLNVIAAVGDGAMADGGDSDRPPPIG